MRLWFSSFVDSLRDMSDWLTGILQQAACLGSSESVDPAGSDEEVGSSGMSNAMVKGLPIGTRMLGVELDAPDAPCLLTWGAMSVSTAPDGDRRIVR